MPSEDDLEDQIALGSVVPSEAVGGTSRREARDEVRSGGWGDGRRGKL